MRTYLLIALSLAALLQICRSEGSEKDKRSARPSPGFSTYRNNRFGFEVSYPKTWKVHKADNGDGMTTRSDNREWRVFSELVRDDGDEEILSSKRILDLLEHSVKPYIQPSEIKRTKTIMVNDRYRRTRREGVIGYYRKNGNDIIHMVTKDDQLFYQAIATNMDEETVLKLLKSYAITRGGEKQ